MIDNMLIHSFLVSLFLYKFIGIQLYKIYPNDFDTLPNTTGKLNSYPFNSWQWVLNFCMWSLGRYSSHRSPQKKGRENKLVSHWGGTFPPQWQLSVTGLLIYSRVLICRTVMAKVVDTPFAVNTHPCVKHLQKDMAYKVFSLQPSLMNWWQREEDPQGSPPSPFTAVYNYWNP